MSDEPYFYFYVWPDGHVASADWDEDLTLLGSDDYFRIDGDAPRHEIWSILCKHFDGEQLQSVYAGILALRDEGTLRLRNLRPFPVPLDQWAKNEWDCEDCTSFYFAPFRREGIAAYKINDRLVCPDCGAVATIKPDKDFHALTDYDGKLRPSALAAFNRLHEGPDRRLPAAEASLPSGGDLVLLNLLDEWDRYAGDSPEYRDSPFAQRVNAALVARGRRMPDRTLTEASSKAMEKRK